MYTYAMKPMVEAVEEVLNKKPTPPTLKREGRTENVVYSFADLGANDGSEGAGR